MPFLDGVDLINKAIEQTHEQRDWDLYRSVYPNMDKKSFVSFDKFRGKNVSTSTNKPKMTKQEIIDMAENIRMGHQGGDINGNI
jgi:hypothetical protein